MPCDTMRLPQQTAAERMLEVRKAVPVIARLLAAGQITVKVGPQGAVTFTGITDTDRARMTDACIYRLISGPNASAAVKMKLARAEQLAGRSVDRRAVAAGVHSHDGGQSWHAKG